MIWLLLFLLLLCAPYFFVALFALVAGIIGALGMLVMGFIIIWAILFGLLAVAGVETEIAFLLAFGLAFPVGWVVLGWVPEPETEKWRFPRR